MTVGRERFDHARAKDEGVTPRPVELVVLATSERAARCRRLATGAAITLRATRLWTVAPGHIIVVAPSRQWTYARHEYLAGVIESMRLDAAALGLVPLTLTDQGLWDPAEHYWGEDGDPIEDWAKPIIARGPRREFEMEQVLPGDDRSDVDSDPIIRSNDLKDAGDFVAARKVLMDLCHADLRCLDAHAHLGNMELERSAKDAIKHYEAGLRIGELSLNADFDGLLPWGHIDNRPFLRCTHGYGLCCWRLGRLGEAAQVFERMLWLNPSDNQGARCLLDDARTGAKWMSSP
jgi:hypothetical protein